MTGEQYPDLNDSSLPLLTGSYYNTSITPTSAFHWQPHTSSATNNKAQSFKVSPKDRAEIGNSSVRKGAGRPSLISTPLPVHWHSWTLSGTYCQLLFGVPGLFSLSTQLLFPSCAPNDLHVPATGGPQGAGGVGCGGQGQVRGAARTSRGVGTLRPSCGLGQRLWTPKGSRNGVSGALLA